MSASVFDILWSATEF